MLEEYLKVVDIVASFDKNLLLIKGWSVTFGLATIALGFKEKSRGLFIIAAFAALCFWILEAETKWHQSNYYLRMNQIEVSCQANYDSNNYDPKFQCPKIDWSWRQARDKTIPHSKERSPRVAEIELPNKFQWYILPNVFLPHLIVMTLGFVIGLTDLFEKWISNETS